MLHELRSMCVCVGGWVGGCLNALSHRTGKVRVQRGGVSECRGAGAWLICLHLEGGQDQLRCEPPRGGGEERRGGTTCMTQMGRVVTLIAMSHGSLGKLIWRAQSGSSSAETLTFKPSLPPLRGLSFPQRQLLPVWAAGGFSNPH